MVNRMLLILIAVMLCIPAVRAIEDPGTPDTVRVQEVHADPGQKVTVDVYLWNDEDLITFSVPVMWSSSDITMDSISYVGGRAEHIIWKPNSFDNNTQTAIFGVVWQGEAVIGPGFGPLVTLYFDIPPGTPDQKVDITIRDDQFTVGTVAAEAFTPQKVPGRITIGNPPDPPHIDLKPESMYFEGTIGFPDPQAQTLTVGNTGGEVLAWSSTSTGSWLTASPSSGTATSYVAVRAAIGSLTEGTYVDTLVIECPEADNTPQYLPVTFEISKLPPEIVYSPSSFTASAIQGGSNPPDQHLSISTDVPGSELNWTVSNSSSWLSLSPASGTPPDEVTLSFDITGLGFGVYKDTVVISDPQATNNPQKVPVTLEIVSNLPVLAFGEDTVYVVVPTGTTVDPVTALIYNDGEGTLTYTATKQGIRITSITPSSGTAPQEISISLKTFPLDPGDFLDSILVESPEAVNSPRLLYLWLHVSNNPARLAIVPSHLNFTYYECWQGPNSVPPEGSFSIQNIGDGELDWWIEHSADWLLLSDTTGTDKTFLTAYLAADGLPVGTYYDTLVIRAPYALESPKYLSVQLDVIPGTQPPQMVVSQPNIILTAQEVYGPRLNPFNIENIYNDLPGCMDYRFEEDIPWLTIIDSVGEAPDQIKAFIDGNQISYGTYNETFYATSTTADNTPIPIDIELKVWRLYGDVNWDNTINVVDAYLILLYVFFDGTPPQPAVWVGDVNCDARVNVTDAQLILQWIFFGGDAPCGNP